MHSAAIPCQRLPHVRPSGRRAIYTRHPLRLPTNERETPSCALRVGNAHDTFMHSNKHASLAIYCVPGLHINSSVASGACDCSVFQRPAKCKKTEQQTKTQDSNKNNNKKKNNKAWTRQKQRLTHLQEADNSKTASRSSRLKGRADSGLKTHACKLASIK